MSSAGGLEFRGVAGLRGPLAFVRGVPGAAFHEHVDVIASDGVRLAGRVLAVTGDVATIEISAPPMGCRSSGRASVFTAGR